jgi:hypothetical protein
MRLSRPFREGIGKDPTLLPESLEFLAVFNAFDSFSFGTSMMSRSFGSKFLSMTFSARFGFVIITTLATRVLFGRTKLYSDYEVEYKNDLLVDNNAEMNVFRVSFVREVRSVVVSDKGGAIVPLLFLKIMIQISPVVASDV